MRFLLVTLTYVCVYIPVCKGCRTAAWQNAEPGCQGISLHLRPSLSACPHALPSGYCQTRRLQTPHSDGLWAPGSYSLRGKKCALGFLGSRGVSGSAWPPGRSAQRTAKCETDTICNTSPPFSHTVYAHTYIRSCMKQHNRLWLEQQYTTPTETAHTYMRTVRIYRCTYKSLRPLVHNLKYTSISVCTVCDNITLSFRFVSVSLIRKGRIV